MMLNHSNAISITFRTEAPVLRSDYSRMTKRLRTPLTQHTWVDLYERWLLEHESSTLQKQLVESLSFEQRAVTLFGKSVMQPRLIAWCGDVPYRYSGLTLPPREIPACLTSIQARVSAVAEYPFNHILLNLYRSGKDGMGMHADNERELGADPIIATLSLGAPRRFVLAARQGKHRAEYQLTDGSLLVMGGRCQTEYVHGIPKTNQPVAPRLSLTFRRVVSPA